MPNIFVSAVVHNYYKPNESAAFKLSVYYFDISLFRNVVLDDVIPAEGKIVSVPMPPANRTYYWRATILDGTERETVQTPLIYENEGQQITFHFLGTDAPKTKALEPTVWTPEMADTGTQKQPITSQEPEITDLPKTNEISQTQEQTEQEPEKSALGEIGEKPAQDQQAFSQPQEQTQEETMTVTVKKSVWETLKRFFRTNNISYSINSDTNNLEKKET